MIERNSIIPMQVQAFDPEGVSLGWVNEYEFNDLRIQIKNKKLDGYYVVFKGHEIQIEKTGKVLTWPVGFFDLIEEQFSELFRL